MNTQFFLQCPFFCQRNPPPIRNSIACFSASCKEGASRPSPSPLALFSETRGHPLPFCGTLRTLEVKEVGNCVPRSFTRSLPPRMLGCGRVPPGGGQVILSLPKSLTEDPPCLFSPPLGALPPFRPCPPRFHPPLPFLGFFHVAKLLVKHRISSCGGCSRPPIVNLLSPFRLVGPISFPFHVPAQRTFPLVKRLTRGCFFPLSFF